MNQNRMDLSVIEAEMLARAAGCEAGKTFCPSEVARAVAGQAPDAWGAAMVPVRRVAIKLALEGRLVIHRKGKPADPLDFKGVYRLAPPRLD